MLQFLPSFRPFFSDTKLRKGEGMLSIRWHGTACRTYGHASVAPRHRHIQTLGGSAGKTEAAMTGVAVLRQGEEDCIM